MSVISPSFSVVARAELLIIDAIFICDFGPDCTLIFVTFENTLDSKVQRHHLEKISYSHFCPLPAKNLSLAIHIYWGTLLEETRSEKKKPFFRVISW